MTTLPINESGLFTQSQAARIHQSCFGREMGAKATDSQSPKILFLFQFNKK